MAFTKETVWEIQTAGDGGDDANGGGFDAVNGTPGTDYTQGAGLTHIHFTDLTATYATPSVISSAGRNFIAADVGNVINISAGTHFIPGRYLIVSVAANAATLDRACCTEAANHGDGVAILGGALATLGSILGTTQVAVGGNTVFVKAGTYTLTATDTIGADGNDDGPIRVVGYSTNRNTTNTDTRPLVTTSTNSTPLFTHNAALGVSYHNLSLSNTASTRSTGFTFTTSASKIRVTRCLFDGFSTAINMSNMGSYSCFEDCEIKNCTTSAFSAVNPAVFFNCYFHDNAQVLNVNNAGQYVIFHGCIVAGCTSSNGAIYITGNYVHRTMIWNSVFYDNAGGAIQKAGANTQDAAIMVLCNNIFYNNGDVALQYGDTEGDFERVHLPLQYNNAFGANTGGNYTNWSAGIGDIDLTGDPFTDAANGDFSLNNTAGAGAACRNAAYPASINGISAYADIGAIGHQDSTGSTSASQSPSSSESNSPSSTQSPSSSISSSPSSTQSPSSSASSSASATAAPAATGFSIFGDYILR